MASTNHSLFLHLSQALREKIYYYLLAPDPEDDVTTINYNLEWPFLENPRNSTFTPHQLDLCRCPQQQLYGSRTEDHIYTRYICQGPHVRFSSKREDLWLLHVPYGLFNILRPASNDELQRRPSAAIVLVNKLTYQEALPYLYRNRNFLFLTGPCPRGRYQAYATQKWLCRLSPFARKQITSLSLICQVYEEDCRDRDSLRAYASLSRYIHENVPRCRTLRLNYWSEQLVLHPFCMLFQRERMRIFVKRKLEGEDVYEFREPYSFLKHCNAQSLEDSGWMGRLKNRQSRTLENTERILEDSLETRDLQQEETAVAQGEEKSWSWDDCKVQRGPEDDWVVAGMSPTGSSEEIETDVWEVI